MSIKDPIHIGHRSLLQYVLQLTKLLDFPMQIAPRKLTILLYKECCGLFKSPFTLPALFPSFSPFRLQISCALKTASHTYRH